MNREDDLSLNVVVFERGIFRPSRCTYRGGPRGLSFGDSCKHPEGKGACEFRSCPLLTPAERETYRRRIEQLLRRRGEQGDGDRLSVGSGVQMEWCAAVHRWRVMESENNGVSWFHHDCPNSRCLEALEHYVGKLLRSTPLCSCGGCVTCEREEIGGHDSFVGAYTHTCEHCGVIAEKSVHQGFVGCSDEAAECPLCVQV